MYLPILTRLMFNNVRMHTYIYIKLQKNHKNYKKFKKIVLV